MGNLTDIIDLVKSMGLILAVVFYVAIVFWTYKDARKRLEDPILVATATAVSMLPLVGVFVYMLLRPAEYLADVRERELEIRMMERELGRQERCPYCKSHIEAGYLSCPVCTTKLRQSCTGCEKPLDPRWVMCPFCETEVPGGTRSGGRSGSGSSTPRRNRPSTSTASRSAGRERSSGSTPAGSGSASKRPAREPHSVETPRRSGGDTTSPKAGATPAAARSDADIPTEPF